MLTRILFTLRDARAGNSLRDLWRNLRYYWHVREHGHLVLLALAICFCVGLGLAIQQVVMARSQNQELACLALNVYHEARGEPLEGQYAVAQVTLNRVESRNYPDTICHVVYQKNWDWIRQRDVAAFSWTLHTQQTLPDVSSDSWRQAWQVAEDVYTHPDLYHQRLAKALHYHARYVAPSWAEHKQHIAEIGQHIFYK